MRKILMDITVRKATEADIAKLTFYTPQSTLLKDKWQIRRSLIEIGESE